MHEKIRRMTKSRAFSWYPTVGGVKNKYTVSEMNSKKTIQHVSGGQHFHNTSKMNDQNS